MTFDIQSVEGRLMIASAIVSLASLCVWASAFRRSGDFKKTLRALAPSAPRTPAFWTPLDVVIVMFATLICVQLIFGVLSALDVISLPQNSFEFKIAVDPLAAVACVAMAHWATVIGATVLLSRRGPAWTSIGWTYKSGDFSLGLLWSLLLIPPTLWINGFVSQFVPYQHDVLSALKTESGSSAILLLFIATAIVTPIAEEFLFRGLLQSSLTRIASMFRLRRQLMETKNDKQREDLIAMRSRYRNTLGNGLSYWPLWVSSGVFALLHLGQGAAPIPLFFFAMGLGWLYRRTGRLWPSIIVHMMLNGLTLAVSVAAPSL